MGLSRRQFLVRTATCAVLFGLAPGLSACNGVIRHDSRKGEAYDALLGAIGQEQTDMLWYASLAPSSHNVQPWTVIIDSDRWTIGSASSRWLPAVDPENREMLLSVGAFVENLTLAGSRFGIGVRSRVIAQSPNDPELVELQLSKVSPSGYPLERLEKRMTLRGPFQSQEIEASDFSSLIDGDEGFFYFPPASLEAAWLDEATIAANRQQVKRQDVASELASWIRWSDADARQYRNGLTPESMGITGLTGWYVRNFYGRDDVLNQDFRKNTVNRVVSQVAESGGWIVVTSDNGTPSALIQAGRRFERMLLKARGLSIGIHPMSQVLEEAPWKRDVRDALKVQKSPQLLLRVGYTRDYTDPVSVRMPLDRVVSFRAG
ncbi:hypothetical protein CR161_00610 [Prosthecochloris sp. ZM]|uniref:Acg family FMN-binding oxidoreductase n=1 Tax=Prosthecochloris sp. ZM TaxID=2283143 RepID=UPI000DF7C8C7|nr:nitroreductase family protein [Prosthecochloris sp. ZM]RDD29326.1 hypothetical protein CR161_00610 [Prosthecochloris sp. ZM]